MKLLAHLPTVQIVFMRALVSLVICAIYLKARGISMIGKNKKVLFLRGFFGTLSLTGLFYCLQHMPLGLVTVFINLAPIFTVVIAHVFLSEKARPLQILFLLLAFVGVLIIQRGSLDVSGAMTLFAVGVAFVAACAYTCVRILRTTEHPMVVIFYFPLVTLPAMGYPAYSQWVPPTEKEWLVLLLLGVLTQAAQYFMTMAYQLEQASKVMIFNYAGILWGILSGAMIFAEWPLPMQWVGMGVVVLALVASGWLGRQPKAA